MNRPMVAGVPASERLMQQVNYRRRYTDTGVITPQQVAVVLHALADHTAIMTMLDHRLDETSPWPEATSIGRWFHDVGNELEEEVV